MREWQTVTVAFSFFESSSSAAGLPTISERPTITACRPAVSAPERFSSSTMPAGVHAATAFGSSCTSRPTLTDEKPSTSFSGKTRLKIAVSLMCGGSGAWMRMPWTDASALSASIFASSSACVAVAGKRTSELFIPISAAVFCFLAT